MFPQDVTATTGCNDCSQCGCKQHDGDALQQVLQQGMLVALKSLIMKCQRQDADAVKAAEVLLSFGFYLER